MGGFSSRHAEGERCSADGCSHELLWYGPTDGAVAWQILASRTSREHYELGPVGGNHDGGEGGLKPLPRPGFDEDRRFETVQDDPRYFENAEIGKAQLAAMGLQGLQGLHGKNTASFDPASTLVRPAMRVIYGQQQERYGKVLRTDDVVAVPDFFQYAQSKDTAAAYTRFCAELEELQASGVCDPLRSAFCRDALTSMATYFGIQESQVSVRISWYPCGQDVEPFRFQSSGFDELAAGSASSNCVALLALGASREYAFQRRKTGEKVYFPLSDGMLFFFGSDVQRRWRHAMVSVPMGEREAAGGHISLMLRGPIPTCVEDASLGLCPSDCSGDVIPICHAFKAGNCHYGDRCRYSHILNEEKGPGADDGEVSFSGDERPQMRIITVPPTRQYDPPVKNDDVIIVPEFFCAEDDWDIYYQLIKEMREAQANGERDAEWCSWHQGAHLLSRNPSTSPMFNRVLQIMGRYFSVAHENRGTRFNWYRDGSDWKPFHHDSAAFNWERAQDQNCTIGISFGASRELAFRQAKTGELIYFPQRNGMLFFFGKDANIRWQHGINALPANEQDGKGRVSIILWGLCCTAVDEPGSPDMLLDLARNPSGSKGGGKSGGRGGGQARCYDFQRGSCRFGERCRYSHVR